MVVVKESEFKGNPILELWLHEHDMRPFRFGVLKSKLILDSIDEIREFYEKNKRED